MKHVQQPDGSRQCGQACVAMLLGISLKRAISIVGKKGSTRTKDLTKALRYSWASCEDRLTRGEPPHLEGIYLCRVRYRGGGHRSHWVVKHKRFGKLDSVYDPSLGMASYLQAGWISSHVEVRRRA